MPEPTVHHETITCPVCATPCELGCYLEEGAAFRGPIVVTPLEKEVRAELDAMQTIVESLRPLDVEARGRVLRWALERFGGEPRR